MRVLHETKKNMRKSQFTPRNLRLMTSYYTNGLYVNTGLFIFNKT